MCQTCRGLEKSDVFRRASDRSRGEFIKVGKTIAINTAGLTTWLLDGNLGAKPDY